MHLFGTKSCSNSTKSHSKKPPRCNSCVTSAGACQKPMRIWLQTSSLLSSLVLLRRDAYLRHTHPNLDAFRLRNLRSATVSGGDLFDRTLMQEYEQHLIGLGVKPVSKKDRFHPYKKPKRGRGGQRQQQQGLFYQPMPAQSTPVYHSATFLFSSPPRWAKRRPRWPQGTRPWG